MMTQDMKNIYWHQLKDETNGAENYMNLAIEAERTGKKDVAKGFRKMAKDEYTHGQFFYNLIKDDETPPPDGNEAMSRWWRMKERLKKF